MPTPPRSHIANTTLSLCRPLEPRTTASIVSTDRARAPQVRHSFPFYLRRSLYLLQCFPHLSPPPSELRLGRVLRRLDRILRGPTRQVDCRAPSATHGPTPARTWIGRHPGRTLLGAPQGLRRRRPRRHSAWLHHQFSSSYYHFPSSSLVSRCWAGFAPGPASRCVQNTSQGSNDCPSELAHEPGVVHDSSAGSRGGLEIQEGELWSPDIRVRLSTSRGGIYCRCRFFMCYGKMGMGPSAAYSWNRCRV